MLITDPDSLVRNTEIVITPATKKLQLIKTGNLSDDGVTLQCVYSKCKELWKSQADLIMYPFPFTAITEEKFELISGWDFSDTTTRNLIRRGGWALKDSGGVSQEEYACIITLGSLGASDQVYFQQASGGTSTNFVLTGAVNQAVKVYGDATHGNIDYRNYFKAFTREYQKTYASAQLSDIGVTTMTYQVYRFPLTNSADLKITHNDTAVDGTAPYTGMTLTWYGTAQQRSIGGTNRDFHVIINGNNGTAEQIYEFVQRELRRTVDIDDGAGSKIGNVNPDLLKFVGDTLYTLAQPEGGVYIDNFQNSDTNRLVFADDTATNRTFPFVAVLTLQFGDNLVNDANSIYRVFFTNDDAGDNTGRDFGTATAMLVKKTDTTDMAGNIGGASSLQLSYSYESNNQRGAASINTDVPITVVAIGLSTAQYVSATGTIQKSTANVVSLTSSLERNYLN